MIDVDQIEEILQLSKSYKKARVKYQKQQEKELAMAKDFARYSNRQREKLRNDLNYDAVDLIQLKYSLHVACVDAGLADLRHESYYEDSCLEPDAFHQFKWTKKKPVALSKAKGDAA